MNYWQIKILLFLSVCDHSFSATYRIEPPVLSSVLRTTTTESPYPIVNKHFFIHSFPEDEKPITGYNKLRRTNYRIFFITLPKLLDSKTKFATQTSDGTLVYIVNRKGKDDDINLQPTIASTTTTTSTTTQKPTKPPRIIAKKQQLTTPKPQTTTEPEPEIITAPDMEYDEVDNNHNYENSSSKLSADYKEVPETDNNDEYAEE